MKKLGLKFDKRQAIVIILVVFFVLLMMDLNTRLSQLFLITSERDKIQTQVYELKQTRQILITHIVYATSDVAVEEWARVEGHMALEGDVVIIPLPPGDVTPLPVQIPTQPPLTLKNWEVWQILFFGN